MSKCATTTYVGDDAGIGDVESCYLVTVLIIFPTSPDVADVILDLKVSNCCSISAWLNLSVKDEGSNCEDCLNDCCCYYYNEED